MVILLAKKTQSQLNQQEREELILSLEKQIAAAVWLQAIGNIAEAILVSKLLLIKEEVQGDTKVVTGIWVQTIGQVMEAIGVTKQIEAVDPSIVFDAQRLTIMGDILQSVGAAVEAIGGKQILQSEQEGFIP